MRLNSHNLKNGHLHIQEKQFIAYNINLIVKEMDYAFGEINNGKMQLNDLGNIAFNTWFRINSEFPNWKMDAIQIMPNHIQGVIIFRTEKENSKLKHTEIQLLLNKLLSSFTKKIHKASDKINKDFEWHSEFKYHSIHDERELNIIQRFILRKPIYWELHNLHTHEENHQETSSYEMDVNLIRNLNKKI